MNNFTKEERNIINYIHSAIFDYIEKNDVKRDDLISALSLQMSMAINNAPADWTVEDKINDVHRLCEYLEHVIKKINDK